MSDGREASGNSTEVLILPLVICMVLFGLWFIAQNAIMYFSFLASYHMFNLYQHMPFLMTDTEYRSMMTALKFIPKMNPTQYGIQSFFTILEMHGYVWRWVVIPILLYWGWNTHRGVVRYRYTRPIKDVYALIDIQAKHFPASAVIKGKNLLSKHPKIGPWATYELPLDFALDEQLLWASKTVVSAEDLVNEEKMIPLRPFTPDEKLRNFPTKRKMVPHYRYVSLHLDKANDVFAKQLGPMWKGPESLPPLEKALYAIIITHGSGEQAEAWRMIEQISFSWKEATYDKNDRIKTPHYANTKGVDELIKKYGKHPKIREIERRHTHTYNVIIELLTWARTKGRLMHANLVWMRPVNKTLFFHIAGNGGQCPFWEAAGLWAHASIERKIGKRQTIPMVAGAVIALREIMSREHWIDPGEYSEEAQQRQVKEANDTLDAEQERMRNEKTKPGPPRNKQKPQRQSAAAKKQEADGEP